MLLSKNNIAISLFIFINALFLLKYSERVTSYNELLTLAFIGVFIGFFYWKDTILLKIKFAYGFIGSVIFIFLFGIAFTYINVESLMVDRWSVISSFWDNYFQGEYVYFAKSHRDNPPGPMPFYYMLALPFYLIGELGYFSLLAIPALWIVSKYLKFNKEVMQFGLFLLITSFFYLWEVTVRSNIMINGLLILFSLMYCLKREKWSLKELIIAGIMVGLFLSTRNVFVIPYVILFLYLLKNGNLSFIKLIQLGCVAIVTFALTFLPFIYNYWDSFLIMNPFVIQGSFLIPFHYTVGFVLLAFLFPFLCKSKEDVFFYSGVNLFITITIYFIYHIIHSGFQSAFYESIVDISYFILCIPFFLIYFLIQENEKSEQSIIINAEQDYHEEKQES